MSACLHCGLPTHADAEFCCSGCAQVHAFLAGSGLDDFYDLRERTGGRAQPPAEAELDWSRFDSRHFAERHVQQCADGSCEVRWHVGGLHCAACIWLLEQLPRLVPGVRAARASFGNDSLVVRYLPERVQPSAIAAAVAQLGYRCSAPTARAAVQSAQRERRAWLQRFVLAAASAAGTMHLSLGIYAGAEEMGQSTRVFYVLAASLVALPVIAWAAVPFYRAAWQSLRLGRASLDLSITAVVVIGLLVSAINLARGSAEIYVDAIAMFLAFLIGGRAALAAARLAVLQRPAPQAVPLPDEARVVTDSGSQLVALSELMPGDRVRVEAGELLPCDGEVVSGSGAIDAAVLSGESRALAVRAGAAVHAGTILRSGELELRCVAVGSDTRVGRILEQVAHGAMRDTAPTRLADRIQRWFAPLVILLAIATGALWWWLEPARAWDQAVAIVLACCPCAFGLVAPLAYRRATQEAAEHGILIRDGGALEDVAAPMHVVFDKTGTLTHGGGQVSSWTWLTDDEQLREQVEAAVLAGEQASAHPLADVLCAWLERRQVQPAADVLGREHAGAGLSMQLPQGELRIGNAGFTGVDQAAAQTDGTLVTRLGLSLAGVPLANIAVSMTVDPAALQALQLWREQGATLHLCSGDAQHITAALGRELGFDQSLVRGDCSPEDKAAYITRLRHDGPVLMVGDGFNDAPALAAADAGIGVAGGMEATLAASAIYCSRPGSLAELVQAARRCAATIRVALWWAVIYNLIAVVCVMTGAWGPYVCAVAMPVSSLLIVAMVARRAVFTAATGAVVPKIARGVA